MYESMKLPLRFELESKNLALKNGADFLLNYQFDVFESRLTQLYFHYIKKFFPLDNFFVAWLIDFLRKYSPNQTDSQVVLGTEYFTDVTSIFENQSSQKVYHLLQFLNFIKTLDNQDCTTYPFEERNYFIHVFPLSHFINLIGMKQSKTQRFNIREYFNKLHEIDPIIEQFEDGSFRIYATFLYSGVYKKSNRWFVRVYIHEALYRYAYPFMLSRSFRNYKNKSDCLLKLTLIQAISMKATKKVFYLSNFLKQLKLSGTRIVNVKQNLIFLIQEAIQHRIIQNKLELVYTNGTIQSLEHHQLTIKKLNRRVKYLIFYEKLHK
jgi:hypothetical protein